MAEVTREAVMAYLTALGPGELRELILELEDLWQIEAAPTGARWVPTTTTMGMPIVIENWRGKPDIEVVLLSAGERRVQVMKAIREAVAIGLQETVALVEKVPSVITREESSLRAEVLKKELESLGAKVELREAVGR